MFLFVDPNHIPGLGTNLGSSSDVEVNTITKEVTNSATRIVNFTITIHKETKTTTVETHKQGPTDEDKEKLARMIPSTTEILILKDFNRMWLNSVTIPDNLKQIISYNGPKEFKSTLKERLQHAGKNDVTIECQGNYVVRQRRQPTKLKPHQKLVSHEKITSIQATNIRFHHNGVNYRGYHTKTHTKKFRRLSEVPHDTPSIEISDYSRPKLK